MGQGLSFVLWIDLFRTATFRLTLGLVAVIIVGMGLQFSLLYGEMNGYEQLRSNDLLHRSAALLVQEEPHELEVKLRERSTNELRVFLNGAALFDRNHHCIAGDIPNWPKGLHSSPAVQPLTMTLPDGSRTMMRFLVVEVLGPAGEEDRLLVLARSRHMADELRYMVWHAAILSIVPIVLFSLLAGMLLSQRALARIKNIHQAIERIMKGDVHERLPIGRGRDDLERLSRSVNRMLDRLEQLMGEMRDVGNDIAHDLRTPLARVQARLDRASALSCDLPTEKGEVFEKAMGQCRRDLEQCFSIITALLRIGEIESGQRRAGFAPMSLGPLVTDIVDLYEPIAELENIALYVVLSDQPAQIVGDADLLNEVLANLLDNALKFTHQGGWVRVSVGLYNDHRVWVEVRDTGIGIAPEERAAVLGRFYRADKSRHIPGSGLGLSLVAAIIRLHDGVLEIEPNESDIAQSGTVFRVIFPSFSVQNMALSSD